MGTLDRYVFKRSLAAFTLILSLAVCLGVFFDLVLNLENYLSADLEDNSSRWTLIAQLYACRLPLIISGIIPYAMVAAALICLTPMLKRGEWTAAIAGGISPQRIALPLCILALFCGIVQMLCNNVINPMLYPVTQNVEAQFDRKSYSAKVWHLKEQQSTWFAAHADLPKYGAPAFKNVFIAPAHGGALHAEQLSWQDDHWQLSGEIVEWQHNTSTNEQITQHQTFPLSGMYALPLSPDALRQELLTREAFTGLELWQRGDHMYMTLLLNRSLALFIPLLALCCALPIFARFEHQQRLLVAAVRALLVASIPIGIMSISGMAADASNWSPWLSNGIGLACATLPAVYLFKRWTSA